MKTWFAGAKSPDRLRMLISRIQAKQLVWNGLSGTGLNSLLLSWAFPINRGENSYRGDRFWYTLDQLEDMQVRATRWAAAVHYLLHVTAAVSRRGAARGAIGRGTVFGALVK